MTYLFARSVQLAPSNMLDAMDWSTRITEKVNAIADTPVLLWSSAMSADVGRLTWSTTVEDLSTLTTFQDKSLADGGYLDLVEEGVQFSTGANAVDELVSLVHADRDGVETAEYSTVVRAVLAPGAWASGIAAGVEIAQRAKSVTGRSVSFGASQTGVYGGVGWVTLYDSIDQLQESQVAIASDSGFAELLDGNAATWIPGSGSQVINRRVI